MTDTRDEDRYHVWDSVSRATLFTDLRWRLLQDSAKLCEDCQEIGIHRVFVATTYLNGRVSIIPSYELCSQKPQKICHCSTAARLQHKRTTSDSNTLAMSILFHMKPRNRLLIRRCYIDMGHKSPPQAQDYDLVILFDSLFFLFTDHRQKRLGHEDEKFESLNFQQNRMDYCVFLLMEQKERFSIGAGLGP